MRSLSSSPDTDHERCLRCLASHALSQYDFDVAEAQLLAGHSNTLFRVSTVDGLSYLLRICTPSWRTDVDLLSEVVWLQALNRDTDIGVPVPQPARNGRFIVDAHVDGHSEVRRCVVVSWLPGIQLGTQLTEANVYKLGVLFARLHLHAADFCPPRDFTQRKLDNLFAFGEQDVLLGDSCRAAFTPRTRDIVARTRATVDAAFAGLYADPTGLRVMHNDLHHNNVKVCRGRLLPFDFDYTMWGYPVQDLAVALQGFQNAKPDAFPALQQALREGYESQSKWPESYAGQIEAFRTGRVLWAANYVAQQERGQLKEHVAGIVPQLAGFLDTGFLKMP